jgi:hypothetical protein
MAFAYAARAFAVVSGPSPRAAYRAEASIFFPCMLLIKLENLGRGVAAPCLMCLCCFVMVLQFYDLPMRKIILYILVVELICYMMDLTVGMVIL